MLKIKGFAQSTFQTIYNFNFPAGNEKICCIFLPRGLLQTAAKVAQLGQIQVPKDALLSPTQQRGGE